MSFLASKHGATGEGSGYPSPGSKTSILAELASEDCDYQEMTIPIDRSFRSTRWGGDDPDEWVRQVDTIIAGALEDVAEEGWRPAGPSTFRSIEALSPDSLNGNGRSTFLANTYHLASISITLKRRKSPQGKS